MADRAQSVGPLGNATRIARFERRQGPWFDEVLNILADVFDVPFALISLIEGERLWLKSAVGLDRIETDLEGTFCSFTVRSDEVFVVTDATEDARFSSHPYVVDGPKFRFYAAAPLIARSGRRIGAVCVVDSKVRPPITGREKRLLTRFAALIVKQLDLGRDTYVNGAMIAFSETAHLALLTLDRDGNILLANKATEALFGCTRRKIVGKSIDVVVPERFRQQQKDVLARLKKARVSPASATYEWPALRHDGSEFPVEFSFFTWRSKSASGTGVIVRDMSERQQRDARLIRLAQHDPLTGLANRRMLHEHFAQRFEAGIPTSTVILDLDDFKEVNEHVGHKAGDGLLQAIAGRLTATLPDDILISRWSGDKFIAVADGGDPLALAALATRMLNIFATPFEIAGHSIVVGASIGGAIGPNHGSNGDELVAAADMALFHSKTDGGRRFRLFESSMRDRILARNALRDELRAAVLAGDFRLHYQPQISMKSGRIVGVEALLRWQHPVHGLLFPSAFLKAIEEGSLALQVGWWCLDEACRQVAIWRAAGFHDLRMSVNLFAAQFRAGTLGEVVRQMLVRHDLPATALELEVTETIALQHDDSMLEPLRDLHGRGIGIAFDDFGTGYASLSTLRRFPLTCLKIDQSFVRDLLTNERCATIVTAMVRIGRDFGLRVVAEGVETKEQALALRAMGCEVGQGFLFGRAIDPVELTHMLRDQADGGRPAWLPRRSSRTA